MNLWVSLPKCPFNVGKALLGLAFKGRGHVQVRPITKGFMNLPKGVWRGPERVTRESDRGRLLWTLSRRG